MEIHCLGRTDRQVKLNGFRLDLNALEDHISNDVLEVSAVALVRRADYLLATVRPCSLDIRRLKVQLARILPPYALPRFIIAMDRFPTAAGKLDHAALMNIPTVENNSLMPVQWTSTEAILAHTWRDISKLDPQTLLTPDSNFVILVMEAQILRDLALATDYLVSSVTYEPQIYRELIPNCDGSSTIEAEWVQKYQLREGYSAFNVSVAWNFDPNRIDYKRLEFAWDNITDRYSILYSYYVSKSSYIIQRKCHDSLSRVQRVRQINITEEINHLFRIDKDHFIRVAILSYQMIISISHIMYDLTALRTLLNEVVCLYLGTPLAVATRAHQKPLQQCNLEHEPHLDFWSKYLRNPSPIRYLQRSIPARRTCMDASDTCRLRGNLSVRLCRFAEVTGYTLHQLGLTAVSLASQPEFEAMDIVIGAPYLNRQPEEMDTVGLFLEPLPVRIKYQPTECPKSTNAFADFVRRRSQSAIAHAVP
ncbi:MAG: hypothetical protein Q9187_002058 [Circinaria calcarea]